GSTCGGTGVGDGQVWSAQTGGLRVARPSATSSGTRPVLPRILLPLPCGVSAFARIDPPSTVFAVADRSSPALRRARGLPGPNAVARVAGCNEVSRGLRALRNRGVGSARTTDQ